MALSLIFATNVNAFFHIRGMDNFDLVVSGDMRLCSVVGIIDICKGSNILVCAFINCSLQPISVKFIFP
jgi:hypothetical protein